MPISVGRGLRRLIVIFIHVVAEILYWAILPVLKLLNIEYLIRLRRTAADQLYKTTYKNISERHAALSPVLHDRLPQIFNRQSSLVNL